MKRSIARKWAKALESGEYKQGTGQLRQGDSFCCLGVLCNLHAQEHLEIAKQEKDTDVYLDADVELPFEVREWAGMDSNVGYISYHESLITLNDEDRLTFTEIAKVIRKRWKEL